MRKAVFDVSDHVTLNGADRATNGPQLVINLADLLDYLQHVGWGGDATLRARILARWIALATTAFGISG